MMNEAKKLHTYLEYV